MPDDDLPARWPLRTRVAVITAVATGCWSLLLGVAALAYYLGRTILGWL